MPRLYLTNAPAQVVPAVAGTAWNDSSGGVVRRLGVSAAGAAATTATSETSTTNPWNLLLGTFVSPPLAAPGTLDVGASLDFTVGMYDSDPGAAMFARYQVAIISPDGSVQRGQVLSKLATGVGVPSTPAAISYTTTVSTAVAYSAGDRVVFRIGLQAQNSAATPYTGTLAYGGTGTPDLAGAATDMNRPAWIDLPVAMVFVEETSPGEILNIGPGETQQHFSVQLSRDGDAAPLFVSQADIAAGFDEPPYFTGNGAGTAVTIRVPLDGPVIAGSSGPRGELREVNADGSNASWNPATGDHVLVFDTTVTATPTLPDMVLAQVFNDTGSTDLCSLRLQQVSGTTRLRFRYLGTSVAGELAPAGTAVGQRIAGRIEISASLVKLYLIVGAGTPVLVYTSPPVAAGLSCYFKVGCYLQSSAAVGSTEYGQVTLSALQATHSTPAITGVFAGTTPSLGASMSGTVRVAAALTVALPAPALSVVGTTRAAGALNGALPSPTAAAAGKTTSPATLTGQLPAPAAAVTGTGRAVAVVSGVLPVPVAPLTAAVRSGGTLAGDLPAPSAYLAGTLRDPGSIAAMLPLPLAVLGGDGSARGDLTVTLPAPAAALAATTAVTAVLHAALPRPVTALGGAGANTAALTALLPRPAAALSGTTTIAGLLTAQLPVLAAVIDTTTPGGDYPEPHPGLPVAPPALRAGQPISHELRAGTPVPL